MRGSVGSHENWQAGHAFATDQPDFDPAITSAIGHHRRKPPLEKIDLVDRLVGLLELLAQRKIDPLQVRLEQKEVFRREVRQQMVCD